MSDKIIVLKLLWNNLKFMKEKGQSPDATFDFLNEDEMVKYLFNEDQRYIELLLLSLEMQPIENIERLNPEFVSMYLNFFNSTQEKVEKKIEKVDKVEKVEKKVDKVEKVEKKVEKVEKKVEKVEEVEEKVEIDLDDDSVIESEEEEMLSDSDVDDNVEKFISKYLLETDEDNKVSLESIKMKYSDFCNDENEEEDYDELESKLVEKFGKPKGKRKPSFRGVNLLG